MKMQGILLGAVLSIGVFCFAGFAEAESVATKPVSRMKEGWWAKRHAEKVELAKKGNVDLLLVGDSITHNFENARNKVWMKYYASRKVLNLGFGADRTEHVLWRLDNGEIDGISPKLAILMIGTNNTGLRKDKPELIAEGVKAICSKLRTKLPKTKILLLAIFPRSQKTTDAPRVNNEKANKLIAKLADSKTIYFLDINSKFLQADGTMTKEIMPDFLHPSGKGYQIWAESIESKVAELMGGNPIL